MNYSHPNDTKRIELLKEALRWSKLFINELIEISVIDLEETYASELQMHIDRYEQFETQLKQLEDGEQIDLFKELE